MYQIQPVDLSENFKIIHDKKKYSLLFCIGKSIQFTSKRECFDFIGKLSQFFSETLAICEMTHQTINTYSFHIKPLSKSNSDLYNQYHENSKRIFDYIKELKFYQTDKTKLSNVYFKFTHLIGLILDNCEILNKKNKNCVLAYYAIMQKLSNAFYHTTDNAEYFYRNQSLTLIK
ncbi:hypothetical protein [Epilithonimonas mollis]|uniref:Uncharacterized protein n=1 Tax=Epilithonimonas mollis TaxID=216903 RepID=A0A1M6U2M1_9FLAO|nr:hypothetical protein [Epilithonimonas mollis]SHK63515.1 hypothetical protein SAMN05444371_3089 [Epilithonimonas mollis]